MENTFTDNSRYKKAHNEIVDFVMHQVSIDLNQFRNGDGTSPYTTSYWDAKKRSCICVDWSKMTRNQRNTLLSLKFITVTIGGAWIAYIAKKTKNGGKTMKTTETTTTTPAGATETTVTAKTTTTTVTTVAETIEMNFSAINGTEKQIAWAEQIRCNAAKTILMQYPAEERRDGFIGATESLLNKISSAKWWIENRDKLTTANKIAQAIISATPAEPAETAPETAETTETTENVTAETAPAPAKYDRKAIMVRAWEIFHTLQGDRDAKLSHALKTAWAEAKAPKKSLKEEIISKVEYIVSKASDIYNYEIVVRDWANYGKSRTYIKVEETSNSSKHYKCYDFGYIDNIANTYIAGNKDANGNLNLVGAYLD